MKNSPIIHPDYSDYTLDELLEDKPKMERSIQWAKDNGLPYYMTESHLRAVEDRIKELKEVSL